MTASSYVTINANELKTSTSLLLDTGANVCLIKKSHLKPKTLCYTDNKMILRGIDNVANPTETLAYCYLNIK